MHDKIFLVIENPKTKETEFEAIENEISELEKEALRMRLILQGYKFADKELKRQTRKFKVINCS